MSFKKISTVVELFFLVYNAFLFTIRYLTATPSPPPPPPHLPRMSEEDNSSSSSSSSLAENE